MDRKKAWTTLIVTVAIAWGSLATMLAVGWVPKLGLDLQGGFAVTLVAPDGTDQDTLKTAADIMRRRIENLGGVQEPEIAVVGDRSIVVQLPGVDDRERALQAVGTTGELSFRAVMSEGIDSPALTNPNLIQSDGDPNTDPILSPLNDVDHHRTLDPRTCRWTTHLPGRWNHGRVPGWDIRRVPDGVRHHRCFSSVFIARNRWPMGGCS